MNASRSAQDGAASLEQVAHLRHELLTPINQILGLTELQIDEATETGLRDYVPALTEINTSGRTLLAIIEDELSLSRIPNFSQLDARIDSEAKPTLGEARKLARQLHAIGSHSAAEELDLVSDALGSLLAISQAVVQEQVRK